MPLAPLSECYVRGTHLAGGGSAEGRLCLAPDNVWFTTELGEPWILATRQGAEDGS